MSFLHYLEYGFVKTIFNYVKNKPLDESYKIAEKLGELACKLDKKHCNIARENLIRSFGNEKTSDEIENIIRNNFINIAYTSIEFLNFPKIDRRFLEENVSGLEGLNYFKEALEQGKGVINVTGHLGNWELLGILYPILGFKFSVIARRQSNPLVNNFVVNLRTKKGMNIIYHRDANRRGLNTLREDHILALVSDQDARDNGIFVNFFGRCASTARGPAVLNRKTGAPIIMSFLLREKPGKFKLIVEKPINFIKTDNKENDILSNTILWSNLMEKNIRQYPDQWFWVHRRWKTQRKGE
ncbi:lysophospholipid acyltransferase family protein [Candidatus Poribacteria bacterium]|nr:lysophospholipid acyltransferase family protein [Candidatus Poribacteria bacterium]